MLLTALLMASQGTQVTPFPTFGDWPPVIPPSIGDAVSKAAETIPKVFTDGFYRIAGSFPFNGKPFGVSELGSAIPQPPSGDPIVPPNIPLFPPHFPPITFDPKPVDVSQPNPDPAAPPSVADPAPDQGPVKAPEPAPEPPAPQPAPGS